VIAFVVADAHGRLDLIEGLLKKADAGRGLDRTIVQLGDLVNCVASSINDDLETLAAAPDLFDVLLVGNHEHPYFGGPGFVGFWRDPEVENAIRKLDWQAAFSVREFLVTHAGLGEGLGGNAFDHERKLNAAWRELPDRHPYFVSDEGILWTRGPKVTPGFSQIIGHTPGPIRVQGQASHVSLFRPRQDASFVNGRPEGFELDEPFVLCIDAGASKGGSGYARVDRLAGCWIRDGEVEIVTFTADGQPG
jgi:hypothetical protein